MAKQNNRVSGLAQGSWAKNPVGPDHEDWFQAGRVLNAILRNEKRLDSRKLPPRLSKSYKQSLVRDVSIARTAKRQKLTVVSDNKDFPLIRRYYDFDWVSGKEYFI